jgi:mercuric ion transport protein
MSERGQDSKTVWISAVVGVVLVALCCFTPVLVIIFSLVGLSALTPYLDYVLFPALIVLVIVAVMAYRKWQQATSHDQTHSP